jgi:glycosyltransferase involved in cell wall biosynthesis
MLENITPIILTYNEAPNIGRTLKQLNWARDIVVVDSFSEDETLSILKSFPQVRIFQRKFDNHANQCNFALKEGNIHTEWILSLDADYILTEAILEEMGHLNPDYDIAGYYSKFVYYIFGQPLRSSLYPPRVVLFQKGRASYEQDGHAHRVVGTGKIKNLNSPILHDDRKPFSSWLIAQSRYTSLEAEKLLKSNWTSLSDADKIRKMRVMAPFAVFFYCLFVKGLILDGKPGLYYSFQRMLSELLLSLHLIAYDFKTSK